MPKPWFQQDIYDAVKAVRRIQEFTWSVAKLKVFMDNAIENHTISMQLNKLLNSIENRYNLHLYQGITLTRFEIFEEEVSDIFARTITSITNCKENRFHELAASPMFKNLVSLLNISTCPTNLSNFGVREISGIEQHFLELFQQNNCSSDNFLQGWTTLET